MKLYLIESASFFTALDYIALIFLESSSAFNRISILKSSLPLP